MCKLKDELIKRQDQHEEPEEYFECKCGQEITKQQNEDGGLCEQCTWLRWWTM